MTDSILEDTKKVLGIDPSYTAFDLDILMHINTAFAKLHQIGVGPEEGYFIEDDTAKWTDFLNGDPTLNAVKSYVVLSVRLLFDPPATSYAIMAMERQLDELIWRINVRREEVKYPWTEPIVLGGRFQPTLPSE